MRTMDRFLPPVCLAVGVGLSLFLGIANCAAQSPALPPGTKVAQVIVEGTDVFDQPVKQESVRDLIHTQVSHEYSQATVDEDVHRLIATKRFRNVRVRVTPNPISPRSVNVFYQMVGMRSVIREIVYEGAKHIKKDELNGITGLQVGHPLNPLMNRLACQYIERKYHEMGRPFAHVSLSEGTKTSDTRVVFQITEGPKVKVVGIEFLGNNFVGGSVLETHIQSSKQWFGIFGGDYNAELVEHDMEDLRKYYQSHGFMKARISRELKWDPTNRHIIVVFHVDEGPRFQLESRPQIERVHEFPPEQILALTKLKPGDNFSQDVVTADINQIKEYYGYTGREVTVEPKIYESETTPGMVRVHYDIQEKRPARVGLVKVIGNTVTKDNVILRQIPLYPGQVLTYPDLRRAEANLARINIFEGGDQKPAIEVIDSPTNPDSDFKDLLVKVQEAPTGSFMLGVGVNSNAGLTGSIVLNERNFDITHVPTSFDDFLNGQAFRGAGQEMRIEAVPGTVVQRYSATFREPFLFDTQNSLTASAYYYQRIFNEYTESRLGERITLGRRLNQYWSASLAMRVEDVGVHNVAYNAPIDYQSVDGSNFLLGLRGSAVRDTRDSILRSTQGSMLDLSFEQVTGEFTFPVGSINFNKYWTLWSRADGSGKHVLAFKNQTGLAGANAPVYERFFAGGYGSIRGFQFRGVAPTDYGFKVGGDFLFLNSLEYQIPVKANDQLYFVTFLDTGTVQRRLDGIEEYRVAAGFGIRIAIPMLGPVPLALDFGFPIVRAQDDRTQVFAFWLGMFN